MNCNIIENFQIFEEGIESLLIVENQLRDYDTKNANENIEKLTIEEFWKHFHSSTKKLSFECTKLCISYVNPPLPTTKEATGLVQEVQKAVLLLISIFYKFPIEKGKVLLNNLKLGCIDAIQAARTLLKIIKDEGSDGVDARYRQSTGIVWQMCDHLEKLSTNNKDAVLSILGKQHIQVTNSLQEISEALEGDGSDVWDCFDEELENAEIPTWTKEDKDIIAPIVYIIKATKMLFKRIQDGIKKNGDLNTPAKISDFDQICYDCEPLNELVDLIVVDLYPPLSLSAIKEKIGEFVGLIRTALKTFSQSHVCTEDEEKHVTFLTTAIDHNLEKFHNKVNENK